MAMNKNQYEEIQSLIDKKKNKNNNSNNSQKLFQPSITRGPKNPSQRQFSVNEEGDYDKKLNKENNELFNKEISNAMTKRNLYLKVQSLSIFCYSIISSLFFNKNIFFI